MTSFPVIVIGAGQAGLAAGYQLTMAAIPFVILEAADELGQSWRGRWDSLELFTPARFSGLPGSAFPGPPSRYPAKDEVAAYLQTYAAKFELPIQFGKRVTSLRRSADGYRISAAGTSYQAEAVILATGAFQQPRLPAFAADLAPEVVQLHSSTYRNPGQLADGAALVVGAGNSGLQIAAELAAGRSVHLAVGGRQMPLPRRILGADLFWWLDRLGFMRLPVARLPAWLAGDSDVLVGQSIGRLVRGGGVVRHPRAVGAAGRTVTFADGGSLDVANVVWATGYRPDFSWLEVPVLDDSGRPVHTRGVTASPGLYFLGLERLYTSGSSLLGWVGRDAKFVVAHIAASRRAAGSQVRPG